MTTRLAPRTMPDTAAQSEVILAPAPRANPDTPANSSSIGVRAVSALAATPSHTPTAALSTVRAEPAAAWKVTRTRPLPAPVSRKGVLEREVASLEADPVGPGGLPNTAVMSELGPPAVEPTTKGRRFLRNAITDSAGRTFSSSR